MANEVSIFIRREDRPDLRAALGEYSTQDMEDWGSSSACVPSIPHFKGCSKDSKEVEKDKEIGKDDKHGRAPVSDRAKRLHEGSFVHGSLAQTVHATIFI